MVRETEALPFTRLRGGSYELKWAGESVRVWRGSAEQIQRRIPTFARRPFAMDLRGRSASPQLSLLPEQDENRFLDVIVRLADEDYPEEVPVGIVSKRYTLVQHGDCFQAVLRALAATGLNLEKLRLALWLTEYGGRMALKVRLPRDRWFDPGDGRTVALQLECFNSVDRSIPLRLMLVWYRLVCSNGLVLGSTNLRVEQVHNEFLDLGEIDRALAEGLARVGGEQARCRSWFERKVSEADLVAWVDGPLRQRLGVLAAARAYFIARTGYDGEPADRFEPGLPHAKAMRATRRVPGAEAPATNAYAISQVLAWLARERHDVQEQVEWAEAIPYLIERLIA